MNVFITGGSGFVGREIIARLVAENHSVRALVRQAERLADFPGIETVGGDTTKPDTLEGKLTGCDAVIHLVGIIREFPGRGITFDKLHTQSTANMLNAAQEQGVKRYIQMSANGTRKQAQTGYHRTKWEAEEQVRQSALDWTILRPSLIFGPNDMFVNMLARLVKMLPLVPVMGDGQYQLQPVHVDDVAKSFVAALDTPETLHKTYSSCGPRAYSYSEILDLIGKALGLTRVRKIHQPLGLMKPMVSILQALPFFPMTSDQLQMLLEGNVCPDNSWSKAFDLKLRDFAEGITEYVK